jgi:site-specific DNA-methyltransferase (adenine-specific)
LQTDELDAAVDPAFRGIVFCSVQYLKSDLKGAKKEFLKNMGFDVIITDEAHQGSSTVKTQKGILEVESNQDIEDICKTIKLNIFASGTATKTKKYYRISDAFTYEWEIEDEGYMKELLKPELSIEERDTIIQYMVKKHGPVFLECLQDNTLDQDYSKHPAQVLMKYSIPQTLIDEINAYNAKNGTNFGFSYSSLFALKQVINAKGEVCYAEEFDICKDVDGIEILKGLLECIISKNMMKKDTIMKQVEATQTSFDSRKSTVAYPLLFIMYLPTHTRNNTIALLQKTLKAFLEEHNLWSDYNIEYSNSSEDSGDVKEDYNAFIETKMAKTRADKKRGCILLLGDKGSVGITYNECDVTISLDDGHNLDNYKQRINRALTPAPKKTLGICVDLNIQRTYLYLNDMIHRHRRNTKTTRSNAEILQYMFEHRIFLFDPQQINNGKLTASQIMSYYEKEADNIMREIDDTLILEQIICDDDLRDMIKMDFQKALTMKKVNSDLEGDQQDCPKGESTKIQIDAPKNLDSEDLEEASDPLSKEDEQEIEQLINQTCEMCKSFLFPLLALISKSYKIHDFKEIFTDPRTQELIISLLKDKKIELNKDNKNMFISIMNQIMDNNDEIVNNIREIYSVAPAHKLRQLIAKHFIPTEDEKKGNAEVPTPVKLVDEMLDSVPVEFWSEPRTVFEPCCGKGNFVLGIFDRFYKGLEVLYPDSEERCHIIMTECIYYADLTALNVFITTEIMKCHVQSYCGLDELDYDFNCYTGDTLELNISVTFALDKFDAVIGNPPYSTDPSKPDTKPLYDKFIEKYIDACGILLFVVPSRWFVGGKGLDKFRDFMMKRKDIAIIQHEDDATKWFGNNVDIKGGVNYFLKDIKFNGPCSFNGTNYDLSKYDCIIKPKYHQIIDVVSSMESVNKLYMGRFFGVETNDKRFKDNGKIKCYVSTLKSKDRCKYIDNYDFNEKNTFWKVITPEASFKAFSGFGEIFIGKPNEVHTGSYISFRVANEEEAKSLLSYLDTKFANHMLSVRKISQHINGDVCKWIPLVPLDRIWTDDAVCEYLKIDQTMYI